MLKSKSRGKKQPKRVLALPDLEQAKTAVLNSLTSHQRTTDLRPRHSWVRRVVLLIAAARVQPHRRAPVPDSPRTTRVCACDDQPPARRRSARGVRGGRRRTPEPRTRGGYPPRQRGTADRRSTRELADTRARAPATRACDALNTPRVA